MHLSLNSLIVCMLLYVQYKNEHKANYWLKILFNTIIYQLIYLENVGNMNIHLLNYSLLNIDLELDNWLILEKRRWPRYGPRANDDLSGKRVYKDISTIFSKLVLTLTEHISVAWEKWCYCKSSLYKCMFITETILGG